MDERGKRKRAKVSQQRPTNRLDPTTGEPICKTTCKTNNPSTEVQHLVNKHLRQNFESARPMHEKSVRQRASEQIKSDVYTAQCATVVESLDKLGTATATVAEDLDTAATV